MSYCQSDAFFYRLNGHLYRVMEVWEEPDATHWQPYEITIEQVVHTQQDDGSYTAGIRMMTVYHPDIESFEVHKLH